MVTVGGGVQREWPMGSATARPFDWPFTETNVVDASGQSPEKLEPFGPRTTHILIRRCSINFVEEP